MKLPRLLTLAGLAISFALPSLAQEQNTISPTVRQQIEAVFQKFQHAYNAQVIDIRGTDKDWLGPLTNENKIEITVAGFGVRSQMKPRPRPVANWAPEY